MWAEGSQTPPGPALQALSKVHLTALGSSGLSRGEASALEAREVVEPFCWSSRSPGVALGSEIPGGQTSDRWGQGKLLTM